MKKGFGSFLGLRAGKSQAQAADSQKDGAPAPTVKSRHKRQGSQGQSWDLPAADAGRDSREGHRGRSTSEDSGSEPLDGAPAALQAGNARDNSRGNPRVPGAGEAGAPRGAASAGPRLTIQSAAAMAASLGLQVEIVGNAGASTGGGAEWRGSGSESWAADAHRGGDAGVGGPQVGAAEVYNGPGGYAYPSHSTAAPFHSAYPPPSVGHGSGMSHSGDSAYLGDSAYQSEKGSWEQGVQRPPLPAGTFASEDRMQHQALQATGSAGYDRGVSGAQRGEEALEGRASGEGVPQDPGPRLVDEDWAEQVTWDTGAELWSSTGGLPEALPGEPPSVSSAGHDACGAPALAPEFPPGSFRARVCSAEAWEDGYGRARPLTCSQLTEDTPAIRPSRLGICPGHASQHSTDIQFVPVCNGIEGVGAQEQEQVGDVGSGRERDSGLPAELAEWEWEAGEVDGAALAAAIRAAHVSFSTDASLTGMRTCEGLLAALLDVTESTFGFITSNARLPDASPCLKTHAVTNVMWTPRLRAWYAEHVAEGLVFTHVAEQGLFGRAALRGQAVLDNSPQDQAGLPRGHPNVISVAALPLVCGPWIVGVAVVANRIGGYERSLLGPLAPLLSTAASVLFAVAWRAESGRSIRNLLCPILSEGTVSFERGGRVHRLDAAAQAIFGLTPPHARLLPRGAAPPLFLKDLFCDPSSAPGETALDVLLGREPRTLWGRQQGGQRVYLKVHMKGGEGQGATELCEATVQVMLG